MSETFYTGDWSTTSMSYNLPPDRGCSLGHVWIVTDVYCRYDARRHRYHCGVATKEYQSCDYKDWEEFGKTICYGEGCWVSMISGRNFFVTESVFGKQTNHTKELIMQRCGGVVKNNWQPFLGHPNNPYDTKVQNRGVVWGYVKIHFNGLSKVNGEWCIPNKEALVVDSGSWESVGSKQWKKKKWQRGVWSIKDKTVYKIADGVVTAKINTTVKWYYYRQHGDGTPCYNNITSVATFYDTAVMPKILDKPNVSATIVCYNNSVSPYSLIDVHVDDNITMTEITYRNCTSMYHNKLGVLTNDDQNKYFNFIVEPIWLPSKNNTVTRRAGYYVINEAPLSLNKLNINVSTPYSSQQITDYNVTVINSKPSDYIYYKVMFAFLAILGVFIITGYSLLRRLR